MFFRKKSSLSSLTPSDVLQRMKAVINSVHTPVYIIRPDDYRILYANPTLARAYPGDLTGSKCYEVLAGNSKPCSGCRVAEMPAQQSGATLEWEQHNPNLGQTFLVRSVNAGWEGLPQAVLVNIQDMLSANKQEGDYEAYIRQLEELTKAKENSEAVIQALSDNIPNGYIYILEQKGDGDADVRMTYLSAGFDRVTGLDHNEMQKSLAVLQSHAGREALDRMHAARKKDRPFTEEVPYTHPDGRKIWMQVSERLRGGRDGIKIWDGIGVDITGLVQDREKARESDLLKSSFLANMSHEIRTPMNAIVGFLNLLEDEGMDAEARRDFIRIIKNSADQLLTLIGDILDISKLEAGRVQIVPEKTDVCALLADMQAAFQTSVRDSGKAVELQLDVPEGENKHTFLVDGNRLRQVLGNLIGNAVKFTEQGYVRFGCRRNGDTLEFYVEDTGIGIEQKFLADLGKPFHQVHDPGRAAKYGGTGIGLAISKSLVRLMGGDLTIASEPGKGSRFSFTIQAEADQPEIPTPKITTMDNAASNSPDLSGIVLLIAEDTYTNFFFLKTLLRFSNATIIHAWNGQEAIDAVKEHPEIDLVLMDVKMPVMDGVEAVKHVKELRPELYVICQTAYAMYDDKHRLMQAGFDDYISKPINKEELFAKIDAGLKKG